MGLFSDKCPKCGYDVSKKARFCSKCGAPGAGGWWRCPNQKCNQWVGNESEFCPYCKTPLHVASRESLAGGRWQKSPDVFAERFEVNDIKRLIEHGLIIEQGTAALLLDAGAYKDVLGPGSHNLDSLAHKLNHWGSPPPRTVVLVDAGDVVLPLRVENLRSAEEYPLELFAELRLRFAEKGAPMFLENMLKNKPRLTYQELATQLKGEIWSLVQDVCTKATVADLVKDPERRLRMEDAMQEKLQKLLERCGVEIIRVGAVEFIGKEYEAERARTGEVENKRRMFEFDQRLRELTASDRMGQLKTEDELAVYVRQLAQERQIGTAKCEQELALLTMVQRQELEAKEAAFRLQKEMEQTAHEIELKVKWDDYGFDQLVKEERAKTEARRIAFGQEVVEVDQALKWRETKNRESERNLRERREVLRGASLLELIALENDPDKRKSLLALNEQEARRGMSPEQILAMAAERSPAIAEVLARQMGHSQEEIRKALEDVKQAHKDSADRAERLGKEGLEAAKEIARHITPTSNQQIIK